MRMKIFSNGLVLKGTCQTFQIVTEFQFQLQYKVTVDSNSGSGRAKMDKFHLFVKNIR